MKSLAAICALVALTLLAGCGWHLRGYDSSGALSEGSQARNAAMATLKHGGLHIVSENRYNAFYSALTLVLTKHNIKESGDSAIIVQLSPERMERKPLAYGSTGVPAQYELTLSLNYQLSRNGETLFTQRQLLSRRNYDFDPDLVVEKDREREELLAEMRIELSERMLSSIAKAL